MSPKSPQHATLPGSVGSTEQRRTYRSITESAVPVRSNTQGEPASHEAPLSNARQTGRLAAMVRPQPADASHRRHIRPVSLPARYLGCLNFSPFGSPVDSPRRRRKETRLCDKTYMIDVEDCIC